MSRFLGVVEIFESLKIQGRILFALLALFGASIASAALPISSTASIDQSAVTKNIAWKTAMNVKLPEVSVLMGREYPTPTYHVQLPGGQRFELRQTVPVNFKGLTPSAIVQAGDDARFILENVIRIVIAREPYAFVAMQDGTAHAAQIEGKWLEANGLKHFDPISAVMEERSAGKEFADLYEFVPAHERAAVRNIKWRTSRTFRVFQFLRDAVFTSTVDAAKAFWRSNQDFKGRVQEFGFQIQFRGEFQIGAGKFSVTKNFPLLLSVGFNREKRAFTFRRSTRKETMSAGTSLSVAGKVELRAYRLIAEVADAGDARKGYAGFQGKTWYPPSIPFVSTVVDTAPGYQSAGLSFGLNLADAIPGSYLMNTVTAFKDEQRVYTAEIPDAPKWLKQFGERLNESAAVFGGSGRGARCEALFRPSLVN